MRAGVNASCVALPNVAHGLTILAFLQQRFPNMAASVWQERMHAGLLVDENGLAVSEVDALSDRLGMHLYYYRDVPNEMPIPFQAEILYEDEHLLVADKPHFLPVMPAGEYLQHTLLVRLRRAFDLPDLAPLHRIDRETAGVVMFAKHEAVRGAYHALFRERQIHKQYEAIARWRPELAYPFEHASCMQESGDFFRMGEAEGVGALFVVAHQWQAPPIACAHGGFGHAAVVRQLVSASAACKIRRLCAAFAIVGQVGAVCRPHYSNRAEVCVTATIVACA